MTSNNERTVSRHKEKRVKKELRAFTPHKIDDLFKSFITLRLLKDKLHILYINIKKTPNT